MATTYTLIASNTLSSSAASVTFSAIPNTYTDLHIKYSARTDYSSLYDLMRMRVNNLSTTIYSDTVLYAALTPLSTRGSALTYLNVPRFSINGNNSTSNTFSNGEIYIPSYTASQNKPVSAYAVTENNTSDDAYKAVDAGLIQTTSAISEILLYGLGNFVTGSSFFLYGIKNS